MNWILSLWLLWNNFNFFFYRLCYQCSYLWKTYHIVVFFFWEVRSHEWNENQASLMSRTGAGSLPEVLFQNTGLKFSLLRGEGEREFWNTENLWGLSLAQTPHYTPLEAKWHESPGGQGDPGEELLESRCVERKRKERMKNNIFHLWY